MRCGWQRRARRRLGFAVRGLLCAAVLAGCMAHRPAPLRIGMTPWPGNPFLYLAAAKGFFAAEGVQVQLVESGSLRDLRRAPRAGVGVQELHDALGGVTMLTSREQRALFAPDGALVAAVDALRTSGGGDDGSAADCLAPELLARAGGRR